MASARPPAPRMALIAVIVGLVVLVFAWIDGFLSAARISSARVADAI